MAAERATAAERMAATGPVVMVGDVLRLGRVGGGSGWLLGLSGDEPAKGSRHGSLHPAYFGRRSGRGRFVERGGVHAMDMNPAVTGRRPKAICRWGQAMDTSTTPSFTLTKLL